MGKAPNEPNHFPRAPNEAVGKMGKAPNEPKPPCSASNEAIGKMGKAPNEPKGSSAVTFPTFSGR
jgi:hypothetical protein